MPSASPYCTERDLEKIRLECQAISVPLEDGMRLWTPAEARTFFMSSGCDRPDADALATRSPNDKAPKPPCCGRYAQEMCLCVVCCCGLGFDQMTMALIDKSRKKREKVPPSNMEMGGRR